MRAFILCAAVLVIGAGPVTAQTKPMVDQTKNWETFLKLYPKRALAAQEQGLVGFNLTLDRAGHPTECQVTHSSGHNLLDDETCELLMMHAVFQPPRDAQGEKVRQFRTSGVINWRIPTAQQGPTSAVKIASIDPLEKKICTRTVRTGTIAGFERRCATAREWEKTRREIIDDFEEQRKRGFTAGKD